MNTKFAVPMFLMVFALNAPSAHAQYLDAFNNSRNEINSAIGLQGWYSQANAKWQISFPYTTQQANPGISAGTSGKIESRLDFKKIDSPVFIMTGGGNIAPRVAFDLVYGFGSISGGRGTDTDRFVSPSGGGLEFSQSRNTLDGEVNLWGFNFYFNSSRLDTIRAAPWGLVLGFLHYEDNLQMRDGVQTVAVTPFEGLNLPPAGTTFTLLDSSYDFSWDLFKAGILHRADLARGLSYAGCLAIYPYVHYRGEGYWNLRAGTSPGDFRRQRPNFVHDTSSGHGYEASLELAHAFSENAHLRLGYRVLYLYGENGVDITYFANGITANSTLDWVTVTRHGVFTELLFRF